MKFNIRDESVDHFQSAELRFYPDQDRLSAWDQLTGAEGSGGEQISALTQLETYVYEEGQNRYVWTWTWAETDKFLVLRGVQENPVGIRVRIR